MSDLYDQEQDVPQGAVLSTTLFNVKLYDIINCLDYKTDGSFYVDDFCICFRSKNVRTIERHLQQCLNRIEAWATRNGFKFSKSKTQCVHFCQQRKYTMTQLSTYMDLKYQNFLGLYLMQDSLLYPI